MELLPLDNFLIAFRMVLNSIVFIFNKKMYKQNIWDPYEVTFVTVVINMVMKDFEEIIIGMPVQSLFYYRYVDDIILVALSRLRILVISLIRYTLDCSLLWRLALMEK